jgi:UDPglucose--hexose-1-phosphate uridylyltransferase
VAPVDCPFCNIKTQENPVLVSEDGKIFHIDSWEKLPNDWSVIVVPNKFPAFMPSDDLDRKIEGNLYEKVNAVGYHEVVITRDHDKHLGQLPIEKVKEVFDVYQQRYLDLMDKNFVNHISIFHNHGKTAGASIAHPHSQIITTPLVDIDLRNSLFNSQFYEAGRDECIYCQMNKWEMKVKERIVFENEGFLAICPFASKTAFEVIITPKNHRAYFEKIEETEKLQLAEAFQVVLGKIAKGLNEPDFNFYLHTAPADDKNHDYFHWHWTILPKTSAWAGFEMGTKMEISTIEPEKAAEYLREQ